MVQVLILPIIITNMVEFNTLKMYLICTVMHLNKQKFKNLKFKKCTLHNHKKDFIMAEISLDSIIVNNVPILSKTVFILATYQKLFTGI